MREHAAAPFRWYEDTPTLLQKGSTEKLIAMARQADASLQAEFGLPLGLVVVDTLAACTGYTRAGEENDAAVGTAMMNVLKAVALATNCFVLGVAHFGKNLETAPVATQAVRTPAMWSGLPRRAGRYQAVSPTRGWQSASTRVAPQGQEYPFTLRTVAAPELDEDGEPITTKVVDWLPAGTSPAAAGGAGRLLVILGPNLSGRTRRQPCCGSSGC